MRSLTVLILLAAIRLVKRPDAVAAVHGAGKESSRHRAPCTHGRGRCAVPPCGAAAGFFNNQWLLADGTRNVPATLSAAARLRLPSKRDSMVLCFGISAIAAYEPPWTLGNDWFSLDGLGIADAAPGPWPAARPRRCRAARIRPEEASFSCPPGRDGHRAFHGNEIGEIGIRGEVINGLTSEVGNVSSCSVPYALRKTWNRLQGIIVCPTAGVGNPGGAEVSHGCVILQATDAHR